MMLAHLLSAEQLRLWMLQTMTLVPLLVLLSVLLLSLQKQMREELQLHRSLLRIL